MTELMKHYIVSFINSVIIGSVFYVSFINSVIIGSVFYVSFINSVYDRQSLLCLQAYNDTDEASEAVSSM